MQIKDGVTMAGLKIEMRPVLVLAETIWRSHGQELVITCGLDGTHAAGSLHYYGLAVDLRSKYFENALETAAVVDQLQEELGATYDVIQHKTHIHVEYDPRV